MNSNLSIEQVLLSLPAEGEKKQGLEGLYAPITYTLEAGGKRMRPTLMQLAYKLYRDDVERCLSQACGLETYHNFTLLHDDLMDNAPVRRHRPTVHKKWNANTAILSGDTMTLLAYQHMANCDAQHLPEVLQLFTRTAIEICEGQQLDMDFEQRNDVTEAEYIEMIRLKTAVLLACALKIGAVMADAPKEEADTLYEYGIKIGLAFQLQDDFLDVYGDPAVFGKAIGGDIMENKKTFMLINALNMADAADRAELERWINAETPVAEEKIKAVTALYNKIGVDMLAQKRINTYFVEAEQLLNTLTAARKENVAELAAYANKLMKRDK